ncbi:MAG TPA: hypothetical protein VF648_18155 [Pyrinomonadaceae bacterium]|jgi:hypothetical protein
MKNTTQFVKSLLFFALILGFFATLITPNFAPAVNAAATKGDNTAENGTPEIGLNAILSGVKEKKFKVLKGDAVKLRFNQLRTKDKAFNRAVKDLEKINKRINWNASMIYLEESDANTATTLKSPIFRSASFNSFNSFNSTFDTDAYGNEMIIMATDGDQSYWDGTIYVHDAETGNSDTYNAVVNDFDSEDPEGMTVVDELYYPPDGGAPYREQPAYSGYYSPYQNFETRDRYQLDMQLQQMKNDKGPQKKSVISKASYSLAEKAKARKFFTYIWRYIKCVGKCSLVLAERAGCAGIAATSTRNRLNCFIAQAANAAFRCAFNPDIRNKPHPNTCTFN